MVEGEDISQTDTTIEPPYGPVPDRDVLSLIGIYAIGTRSSPCCQTTDLITVEVNDHIVGVDRDCIA